MGQPHSGKTEMAFAIMKQLLKHGHTADYLNGNELRKNANDFDYTAAGQIRQSLRINELLYKSESDFVIVDLIHPLRRAYSELPPALVIWMGATTAICESQFQFVNPIGIVDWCIEAESDIAAQSIDIINKFLLEQESCLSDNTANKEFITTNNK